MRVVSPSGDQHDTTGRASPPVSDEVLFAPSTGPMPRPPTPNRTKSSASLSLAVAPSATASPAKTPMQPRRLMHTEESFDFSDFIALFSVVGPVIVQSCSLIQTSLASGGAPAARAFRQQRGVERVVFLMLDLLQPSRIQADWSAKARKTSASVLLGVVNIDPSCSDCFFESYGTEMCILLLSISSDRVNHDCAVSLLETVSQRGAREARLVEVLLGSARPQNVTRPSGFAR
jgi:hypothetical protein